MRRALALPLCLLVLPAPAKPPSRLRQTQEVQEAARSFFRWYDGQWREVGDALTAAFKTDPAAPFGIDFEKLRGFTDLLMSSGCVDPELLPRIEAYYRAQDASVSGMTAEARQEAAGGILMACQDQDPLYFAQETGLGDADQPPFSSRLGFDHVRIRGDRARLRVVSPFGWTEEVALVRRNGTWRLTALGEYR